MRIMSYQRHGAVVFERAKRALECGSLLPLCNLVSVYRRVTRRQQAAALQSASRARFLRVLALVWLLAAFPTIQAAENESLRNLFTQANSEYQKNNFGSAEQMYRQILDSGFESGPLLYNMGNVCFKQKRLGEAIWYWEKALQKMPGDQETQENLQMANSLIVDRIESQPDPLPIRVLQTFQDLLSLSQEAWLVLVFFVAANAAFSMYLFSKNNRRAVRAFVAFLAAGFLFIAVGCSWCWKIYQKDHRTEGILVESKVDILSGPGAQNTTLFTIHEGIKVRVHDSTNGWYQISLPNGWNGWLPQDKLRIL